MLLLLLLLLLLRCMLPILRPTLAQPRRATAAAVTAAPLRAWQHATECHVSAQRQHIKGGGHAIGKHLPKS